jgi:methyl-accepting chemotaxis protein
MPDKKADNLTVEILINIRDEIRGLREDTNRRFEQMDRRFEQMDRRFEKIEADIAEMKKDLKIIVARFDRDYLLLANEVGEIKGRMEAFDSRLERVEAGR